VSGVLLGLALWSALGGRAAAQDSPAEVPPDAAARVVSGLVDAGLVDQALAVASEARAGGASPPRLDVAQARAMHAKGLSAEALTLLEGYLRRHRRDAEAWATRGVVLLDLGRTGEAIAALEHSRKLQRRSAPVHNNLGWALLVAGRAPEAEASFREALRHDPASRRARNNLGFALARQGRDAEALEAFRAVLGEADARLNLASACEWRGDVASAVVQLRAALAAQPDHAPAAAALGRLAPAGPP
jgi:Flp pilus assembly protein TadD